MRISCTPACSDQQENLDTYPKIYLSSPLNLLVMVTIDDFDWQLFFLDIVLNILDQYCQKGFYDQ